MRRIGRSGGYWLNYGFCPACKEKHKPRFGPITCRSCGEVFDNKGLQMRMPKTVMGWGKAIYGGILLAIAMTCLSVLMDWFL